MGLRTSFQTPTPEACRQKCCDAGVAKCDVWLRMEKLTAKERAEGVMHRGATLDYDLWANMAHVRITWLECGIYSGDDHAPLVRAVFRELRQAVAQLRARDERVERAVVGVVHLHAAVSHGRG